MIALDLARNKPNHANAVCCVTHSTLTQASTLTRGGASLQHITGNSFACTYVASDKLPSSTSAGVSSQQQLDELLDLIFAAYHQVIMTGKGCARRASRLGCRV